MGSPRLSGGPQVVSTIVCGYRTVAAASANATSITVWDCDTNDAEVDSSNLDEVEEYPPTDVFIFRGHRCLLLSITFCGKEIWTLSEEALQGWRANNQGQWTHFYEMKASNSFVAASKLRCFPGGHVAICIDTQIQTLCACDTKPTWLTCDDAKELIADAQFTSLPGASALVSVIFASEDGICYLWDCQLGRVLCRINNPFSDSSIPISLGVWDGAFCMSGESGAFVLVEMRPSTMEKYYEGNLYCTHDESQFDIQASTLNVEWNHDFISFSFASRWVVFDAVNQQVVYDYPFYEDVATGRFPIWSLGWLVSLSCFGSDILVHRDPIFQRIKSAQRKLAHKSLMVQKDSVLSRQESCTGGKASCARINRAEAEDDEDERSISSFNDEDAELSVFPSSDPPEKSALRCKSRSKIHAVKQSQTSKPSGSSSRRTNSSGNQVLDKPVTFHKKIRSSGYGTPPQVRSLFRTAAQEKRSKVSRGVSEVLRARAKEIPSYPCDCPVIDRPLPLPDDVHQKLMHQGAVTKVKYSLDGSMLATCGNDGAARAIRLPLSKFKGDGASFMGHQGKVHSIDFSYLNNLIRAPNMPDRPLLLTGGADGTARIWSAGVAHPVAVFSSSTSATPSSLSHTPGRSSITHPSIGQQIREVNQAIFYYVDEFVLLTAGSEVRMHRYEIDERSIAPSKDVNTQRVKNKQKAVLEAGQGSANQELVASWDCKKSAKSILSLAAINAFHSHLAFTSRSDGSLVIIDVAMEKQLLFAHLADRAAHTIALPTHALHGAHPPGAFDMFVTSSTSEGGTLLLWDLRQRNAIQKLQGHQNRVQMLGVSISPCMRYVATGSEDNSCYIYDVRTGAVLARNWKPHRDTVSDVSFHPILPYLATASYDGHVRCFATG